MVKIKIIIVVCLSMVAIAASADADSRNVEYIKRWAAEAQRQQEKYGVPASITLAQGLLESGAGTSRLASLGNNHFGIKCHNTWTGDTLLRSDDAPNECFRSYTSAEESFTDHSLFLLRKRYESLFSLSPGDYRGWAKGLRRCGYATDPQYGHRLISIIERYSLYKFDAGNKEQDLSDTEFILANLTQGHHVLRSRGLHYVIAAPGDNYKTIAKEFNIDAHRLAEYNDSKDIMKEIVSWQEVYLQPKHTSPPEETSMIVIGEDETIHSIAQRLGMTVESIRQLNPTAKDCPGVRLRLKQQ